MYTYKHASNETDNQQHGEASEIPEEPSGQHGIFERRIGFVETQNDEENSSNNDGSDDRSALPIVFSTTPVDANQEQYTPKSTASLADPIYDTGIRSTYEKRPNPTKSICLTNSQRVLPSARCLV